MRALWQWQRRHDQAQEILSLESRCGPKMERASREERGRYFYLRGAFWREVSDWSDFRFDLPDGQRAPDVRTAITAWATSCRG